VSKSALSEINSLYERARNWRQFPPGEENKVDQIVAGLSKKDLIELLPKVGGVGLTPLSGSSAKSIIEQIKALMRSRRENSRNIDF